MIMYLTENYLKIYRKLKKSQQTLASSRQKFRNVLKITRHKTRGTEGMT